MIVFISILLAIAAILLVLIVLIQNPKGGGIAANFSNIPTQLMGVKQSTDLIEKLTWGFMIGILVICLSTTFMKPSGTPEGPQSKVNPSSIPAPAAPQAPAQNPNQGTNTP